MTDQIDDRRYINNDSTQLTQVYAAWLSMKRRCLDPNNKRYADYGGRGITVHTEWIDNFDAFFEHVGHPPCDGLTLDRLENEESYVPGNVGWRTYGEQANNRRTTHQWYHNGEGPFTQKQFAARLGISHKTLAGRLRKDFNLDRLLFQGRVPTRAKADPANPMRYITETRSGSFNVQIKFHSPETIGRKVLRKTFKTLAEAQLFRDEKERLRSELEQHW